MSSIAGRSRDPWSVLDELMTLRGDFNRMFDEGYGRGRDVGFPLMNVWTSESDLVVDLEIPGIDPNSVEITVLGDELSISGSRQRPDVETEAYLRKERFEGQFERTVALPFRVNSAEVSASCRNGVLRITLPRAEADKPRRIDVKAA